MAIRTEKDDKIRWPIYNPDGSKTEQVSFYDSADGKLS